MQNEAGTCQQKWHKTDTSGSPSVLAISDPEKRTAAPTGIGNGGNRSEKHSGAFCENAYHNGDSAATRAGLWYAENRDACPRPVVPFLRAEFGLSAIQAVEAIRLANGVR
ncbi:MAG: hypothetical protein ABTQ31_16995 [Rhizobiaceae bacterium]